MRDSLMPSRHSGGNKTVLLLLGGGGVVLIVAGLLLGPHMLRFVGDTEKVAHQLEPIPHIALGLIALTIGSRFSIGEVRRLGRPVAVVTLAQLIATFALVAGALKAGFDAVQHEFGNGLVGFEIVVRYEVVLEQKIDRVGAVRIDVNAGAVREPADFAFEVNTGDEPAELFL